MTWTIEALNREHPLPEGWLWVMYEGDLIAMRRATDTRREFVCARDGELLADTIDTLNADAVSTAPPVDVALAVLLANKAGGPSTDETSASAKHRSPRSCWAALASGCVRYACASASPARTCSPSRSRVAPRSASPTTPSAWRSALADRRRRELVHRPRVL